MTSVAARRQPTLTVILENVHDPHNIGAVLRSCDSVGIREIFVLYTEPSLDQERIEIGKNASSGARKWIDIHLYHDVEACFAHVEQRYKNIWATHLGEQAVDLYEIDFTKSVALLFGNEHDGVSDASLKHATGNFLIPQMGMVQSLNISVACARSLCTKPSGNAGQRVCTVRTTQCSQRSGTPSLRLILTGMTGRTTINLCRRRHEGWLY